MERKLVVNLFGGSGYGKSTCAALLFYRLKKENIKVEEVFEFAKDLVYMTGITPPFNQAYVFGNQLFKIEQYLAQSDIVIVDSPLPLSIVYNHKDYLKESFDKTVMDAFNSFNNVNFLLDEEFPYYCQGRYQSEAAARESHALIKNFLDQRNIPYRIVQSKDYDSMVEEIKHFCLCKSIEN